MSESIKALELLKSKNWVRLNHLVHDEIPYFSELEKISIKELSNVKEDGYLTQLVTLATQYGTHLDAPFHFVEGKRTLQDITVKERFLPLVVINVEEKVKENEDFELKVDDILEFEEKYGKIEAGTFVALATGWSKRFDDVERFVNKDEEGIEHTPGWSVDALKFLHEERNVTAIGHETLNTDSGLEFFKQKALPAEYYWLSVDKYQIEVLNNLHKLPPKGAVIFIGIPNIDKVSGFGCEVIAIF